MAKKSRKTRVIARTNSAPQRTERKLPKSQNQAAIQKSADQPAVAAANVTLAGRYDYVKDDIIRISIISASLILILVILAFIPALRT